MAATTRAPTASAIQTKRLKSPSISAHLRRQFWFLAVAWLVVIADQLSKVVAIANLEFARPVVAIPGLLNFTLLYNDSAAFSIGGGATWVFSIISSVATLVILWLARKIEATGWALMAGVLLGGVVGNLIDRLTRAPGFGVGHVVDFLQLPFGFPVFNIADSAIVLIAIFTVIRVMRGDSIGRAKTSK